jgi:hypothetical protein
MHSSHEHQHGRRRPARDTPQRTPTTPTRRKQRHSHRPTGVSSASRPSRKEYRSRRTRAAGIRGGAAGIRGGRAVAAGSSGCVFDPPLACEGSRGDARARSRPSGRDYVTKLSLRDRAQAEFEKTEWILHAVAPIANYDDYFIIPTEDPCRPAPLTKTDLVGFGPTCAAPLKGFTAANVNTRLAQLGATHVVNGGTTFFDAVMAGERSWVLPEFSKGMAHLLKGLTELNDRGVMHGDIKEDNVVYGLAPGPGQTRVNRVRLIDWDNAIDIAEYRKTPPKVYHTCIGVLVNQPITYALICHNALTTLKNDKTSSNDVLADKLLSKISRLHTDNEEAAAKYAGVDVTRAHYRAQLLALLDKFRRRGVFNVGAYLDLLAHNYDVYGWLYLNNYAWMNSKYLFTGAFVDDAPAARFLVKYMYSPDALVEPYDLKKMLTDWKRVTRELVTSPPKGSSSSSSSARTRKRKHNA